MSLTFRPPGAPPPVARPPIYIPGIDCSDLAQALRRKQLQDLSGKYYSGVDSLGDRGRSVNYRDGDEILAMMKGLGRTIALCEGTPVARAPFRVFTVPYSKYL